MKGNKEKHPVDDGKSVTGIKCTRTTTPKLRKNKRLEKRWGQKYYAAIKEAVFASPATTYMPAEPPLSLREEANCQPLYVCKQCRDCFHFLSSLEAHNSRRSWILGYWCHNCFFTNCSHTETGHPPCFDCQAINRQRTTHLRTKGLRKGRKIGSIKIFYNQCQFFAHLREHDTNIVDMADVMLMPLPTDVGRQSYAKLEHLCETIMECMFLTRTHIMDWLRFQQLGDKWWQSLQSTSDSDEDQLAELLAATVTACKRKKSAKSPVKSHKSTSTGSVSAASSSIAYPSVPATPLSISETIESVVAQSNWDETEPLSTEQIPQMPSLITFIDPLEPIEDDDNPCTIADIAFVDCGPVVRTFPPDVAILLPPKDKLTIIPNGSTTCSSISGVTPVTVDPHPSPKMPGTSLLIKKHRVNDFLYTTSPSNAFSANSRIFEPKISVKKFASEQSKTSSAGQKSIPKVNNQKPHVLRKLAPASGVRLPGHKTSLPSVMENTRAVETSKKTISQVSLSTLGSKVLTVHSSKNTELSKIISQLPPNVTSGKNIVFIGQDTERFTIPPKNDTTTSSSGMSEIQSETNKSKIIQALPTNNAPIPTLNTGNEQVVRIGSEGSNSDPLADRIKPKFQQVYLDGKVICRNGKKFIIRQSRKSIPESTVCTNINNLKLQTIPRRVSLASCLSKSQLPLTSYIPIAAMPIDIGGNKIAIPATSSLIFSTPPSSSPSPSPFPSTSGDPKVSNTKPQIKLFINDPESLRKSTGTLDSSDSESLTTISRDAPPLRSIRSHDTVEYLAIEMDEAGRSYVDFSKARELSCTQPVVSCKSQMLKNLHKFGARRIKQQIDHLMQINAEYSKLFNITNDAIIARNAKAVQYAETVLKEKTSCSDQDLIVDEESSDRKVDEILLSLTETSKSPFTCSTCNRSIESETHSLAFPRGFAMSRSCRSCINYVCHVCHVFQNNLSRLRAHLNFHAKKEPFACPECFQKFSTFHRLEVHTWSTCFHPLARGWLKCKICQVEGFLSMESLTKHLILTHSTWKTACPECGRLLKSRASLQKHQEDYHPKITTPLKSVALILCEIGNCVVRLENYRAHMDHHTVIINLRYYKCSFCPYLIKTMNGGKEQIKSHLHNMHSEKLASLLSLRNVQWDYSKQSFVSDNTSPSDCNPSSDSHQNERCKGITESQRGSNIAKSVRKNVAETMSEGNKNDPRMDDQSMSEYLEATLTKQILKDGVECSVWSINMGNTESPERMDSGPESLEIIDTEQDNVISSNNVITEYSSSPKIFDVRSVTPDSYAEHGGVSKEQTDVIARHDEGTLQLGSDISKEGVSENFVRVKILDTSERTVVTECVPKDSLLIKMGQQFLPMKLPQVIVINQSEAGPNLTLTASNVLGKFSDPTNPNNETVSGNALVSETESEILQTKVSSSPVIKTVYTLARPPEPEQCKKITIDSTTVTKHNAGGRKQMGPVSVLKLSNNIQKIRNDVIGPSKCVYDSHIPVVDLSQNIPKPLDTTGGEPVGPLTYDIPKPPPLARIPQRFLEKSRVNDEVGENKPQEIKITSPRSMVKSKQRRKQPWRIALNGPTCTSESIWYRCHLCSELINTSWSVLRSHFSSKHSQEYKLSIVTPRLLRMSNEFISEGYKEVLGSKKRKSDGSIQNSKRRRRWNPKKHVEKHPLDPGLCVEQEPLQDGEGNFICKRCDQRCNDISSLRTHIGTNHRIKDHYLVCLECGENFVVEPSLQMHLKAFHRIQDPCAYLVQNPAYAKEVTETIDDELNTGIANQCHVCMAVFEDKLAVDKHLRVHGMAFLNRKRIEARNAARNPEKCKMNKSDASSAADIQKNEKLQSNKLGKVESVNGTAPDDESAN